MEDTDPWWLHVASSLLAGTVSALAPHLQDLLCRTQALNFSDKLEFALWGSLTHPGRLIQEPFLPFSNSFLSERRAGKIISFLPWHFKSDF